MTTEMFKRWRADDLYQCPTIEDVLMCSLQKPHQNFTIKSGNTWYGAGILVVNKKLRMCVIQADDEVYPIHVNQSRSTKYNILKHVQNIQEAAKTYGWGEVVHPWVSTEERAITNRAKFELVKEEFFNAVLRGYDPVVRYMQLTTSNGQQSFPPSNHKELMKTLKEKKFNEMRKWVVQNLDKEPSSLFRTLYDVLYEHLDTKSIPQAILIIAGYQYKSAFVADQEINMVACLTEIMASCKFK